jgi:guanylate kinase
MKFIITLTGPSCSGKSTLERDIQKTGTANRVTSFTTRDKREGEVDGVDYFFVDENFVDKAIVEDEIIQKVDINGCRYGSTKKQVAELFKVKDEIVIVVEPTGVTQFKEAYQTNADVQVISYFVTNKTETLIERMLMRFKEETADKTPHFARRVKNLVMTEIYWGNVNPHFYRQMFRLDSREDRNDSIDVINNDMTAIRCAYT